MSRCAGRRVTAYEGVGAACVLSQIATAPNGGYALTLFTTLDTNLRNHSFIAVEKIPRTMLYGWKAATCLPVVVGGEGE